ncbi:MAG: hypothetical protein M0C28_17000 [Candidatus Moduliflexus flocculans]|nr:hypothetical protein [Candidatus Moduliflexus flocculans]
MLRRQFWDLDSYDGSYAYDGGYLGLAEYTQSQFLQQGLTLFDESNFPNPNRANTNSADFDSLPVTVVTTPDKIDRNTLYLSGYGKKHLAALKYFSEELFSTSLPLPKIYRLTTHLDNRSHEEYQQYLIPKAVGHSAGLLDYFFRGELGMSSDGQRPLLLHPL